jgi:glutamine synthetase
MRGWKGIQESDMLVVPDPTTAWFDPFPKLKTLVLICDIKDPVTHESYSRDPRNIARKAEAYLRSTGIGDEAFIGPEAEFFIFDDIRFDQNEHSGYYFLDSIEGRWNTGSDEGPNLGYKPRYKEGYFPVPPTDKFNDLRNEMMVNLINCGLEIECQHHEVATAGQAEIDIKYDTLLAAADGLMKYKYIVKNTAHQHGKTVTFMPKPVWNDNGSGMHMHLSIWKDGLNQFAGDGYAGMSETALHAIGGILQHAPALVALTNPTTNSYKRLVPGFEAPTRLAYSSRNRSAAVRIPVGATSDAARRFEFRCPDPSCNPYLAFSALVLAALDGIKSKTDPGLPLDKDLYDLPAEQLADVPSTPATLEDALVELEQDHEFLLAGDVFTADTIRAWIQYKREREVDQLRLRPHPYEFALYYDI